MANSTRIGIQHRIEEAKEIERMPFFKKEQSVYDHKTGEWDGTLTESNREAKAKWNQIIDERKARLKKIKGNASLDRSSARGKETTWE